MSLLNDLNLEVRQLLDADKEQYPNTTKAIIDNLQSAYVVGDLTVGREHCMGQSSSTHGYTSGGYPTTRNTIDRFTFSSDANATDHGDLYLGRYGGVGQSSLTHGYTSGGGSASVTYETTIDKFSFASNVTGTDVSDLTVGRQYLAGTQV